jgi:hypothetical protein
MALGAVFPDLDNHLKRSFLLKKVSDSRIYLM